MLFNIVCHVHRHWNIIYLTGLTQQKPTVQPFKTFSQDWLRWKPRPLRTWLQPITARRRPWRNGTAAAAVELVGRPSHAELLGLWSLQHSCLCEGAVAGAFQTPGAILRRSFTGNEGKEGDKLSTKGCDNDFQQNARLAPLFTAKASLIRTISLEANWECFPKLASLWA